MVKTKEGVSSNSAHSRQQIPTLVEHLNLEHSYANIDQADAEQEQDAVLSQFPVLPPFPLHHP
jgi:hypothetical protein